MKGQANASAFLACHEAFDGNTDITVAVGMATTTTGDLRGWKFAKDVSRASRLAAKPDAAVVALCWVDGIFGDDEDVRETGVVYP